MSDSPEPGCSCGDVLEQFPEPRLRPYVTAAQGDEAKALELYAWNARMAGAALEQLSHLEILLRHAIDVCLATAVNESEVRIPWFMLPPYASAQASAVEAVRERLRPVNRETRDQIVAGLSFGYWSGWLGSKYEDLWRSSLHSAFPGGTGRRKEVAALAEQIRKFRNRVAHHDSLLKVDVAFEMNAVFHLAEIISPDAAVWMRSVDRTHEVGASKPISISDTVVVPASDAWALYQDAHAYVCQAGRYFQEVKYVAFYADKQIQAQVPRIKSRQDNVLWSESEAQRLLASSNREDRKLGQLMERGIKQGWTHGVYQVFLLSRPGDPEHVELSQPIGNGRTGKDSAFVRKQRYTSVHKLRHAQTVWDLA